MAQNTDKTLMNKLIYSVFVRNHTPEGTFRALEGDLDRLRALGTDIVWLMPLHPIGEEGRKGTLGSPYAIRDYRGINPEYGTMEDFRHLVDAIHGRGMKCIIDVVYNHTSPDAVYVTEHPEFYYRKPDGSLGYFQNQHCVYNKTGQPCPGCTCSPARTGGIRKIVQGGRSTFYCPTKQK